MIKIKGFVVLFVPGVMMMFENIFDHHHQPKGLYHAYRPIGGVGVCLYDLKLFVVLSCVVSVLVRTFAVAWRYW